jgi:hypothetical protein
VAVESDFDDLQPNGPGVYLDAQWPLIVRVAEALKAVWEARETDGAEPDQRVQYWYVGNAANGREFRIGFDGVNFEVDENTATEAAPVWVTRLRIAPGGVLTLSAALVIAGTITGVTGLTMAGDIDMAGNDFINVGNIGTGTVNGVNVAAHASRHAPGGADAIGFNTAPPAISGASAAGSGAAGKFSAVEHTHKGVSGAKINGAAEKFGSIDFIDGLHTTVVESGQTIKVQIVVPLRTFATKAADTAIVAATNTDIPSLTALALNPATTVSARSFKVSGMIAVIDTSAANNTYVVKLYNGATGTKADTLILHLSHKGLASSFALIPIPPFIFTPALDANIKLGVAIQGDGNHTVKGTTTQTSYLLIEEMQAN